MFILAELSQKKLFGHILISALTPLDLYSKHIEKFSTLLDIALVNLKSQIGQKN